MDGPSSPSEALRPQRELPEAASALLLLLLLARLCLRRFQLQLRQFLLR
jgi:hypothetical protein